MNPLIFGLGHFQCFPVNLGIGIDESAVVRL